MRNDEEELGENFLDGAAFTGESLLGARRI